MKLFKGKACLICGENNMSAGIGGFTKDGKLLCGFCFGAANFGKDTKLQTHSSKQIVEYFEENELDFSPTKDIQTFLHPGLKQTVCQFDDERKRWRLTTYGKAGHNQEAWLFDYEDIASFKMLQHGKYEANCDRLRIEVEVHDMNVPVVYITFIDTPFDISKKSKRYLKIEDAVNECLAELRRITSIQT